jgi:hypothetical protein
MPSTSAKKNQPIDKIDHILSALQDLFILEGLKAGMKVNDIRQILRIDKWRVSNISKCMKKD